jgi:hypothetical protein
VDEGLTGPALRGDALVAYGLSEYQGDVTRPRNSFRS